jgi:hypothetical protein
MKIACLAVMMASMYSCSTGNDEEMISSERNQKNPFVPDVVSKVSLQQFVGKYSGAWWMNGVKTETDNNSNSPNYSKLPYVTFYVNQINNILRVNFHKFPYNALVKQLFSNIDVIYLTTDFEVGFLPNNNPDPEQTLLLNICVENEREKNNNELCLGFIYIKLVGYSENAIYFDLHAAEGSAYLRMPFVVTTKDGNYFAMVLDFLPDKSTVSLDIASGMMSCNLVIRQIEIYDKDMQKSIRSLDQDLKLTFISTEKKSE